MSQCLFEKPSRPCRPKAFIPWASASASLVPSTSEHSPTRDCLDWPRYRAPQRSCCNWSLQLSLSVRFLSASLRDKRICAGPPVPPRIAGGPIGLITDCVTTMTAGGACRRDRRPSWLSARCRLRHSHSIANRATLDPLANPMTPPRAMGVRDVPFRRKLPAAPAEDLAVWLAAPQKGARFRAWLSVLLDAQSCRPFDTGSASVIARGREVSDHKTPRQGGGPGRNPDRMDRLGPLRPRTPSLEGNTPKMRRPALARPLGKLRVFNSDSPSGDRFGSETNSGT
jgi:hypothetical protein